MQVRTFTKNNSLPLQDALDALRGNFGGTWNGASKMTDEHTNFLKSVFTVDANLLPEAKEQLQLPPAFTTLEDFAQLHNLEVAKASLISKSLFGVVKETLTDDDVAQLNQALTDAATEQSIDEGQRALPPSVEPSQITYQTPDKQRAKIQGIMAEDLEVFYPSQQSLTALALRCYEEYQVALTRRAINKTFDRVAEELIDAEESLFRPIINNFADKLGELKQAEIISTQRREERREYCKRNKQKTADTVSEVDLLLEELAKAGVQLDTKRPA